MPQRSPLWQWSQYSAGPVNMGGTMPVHSIAFIIQQDLPMGDWPVFKAVECRGPAALPPFGRYPPMGKPNPKGTQPLA
eukprot:899750-Pelagomonas_calceolata.AAC.2